MLYNAFIMKENEDKTLEGVFCNITLYDNMSLENLKEKLNIALNRKKYIADVKYKDFNHFLNDTSYKLIDYIYILKQDNNWYYMNNDKELKLLKDEFN